MGEIMPLNFSEKCIVTVTIDAVHILAGGIAPGCPREVDNCAVPPGVMERSDEGVLVVAGLSRIDAAPVASRQPRESDLLALSPGSSSQSAPGRAAHLR